MEYYMGSITIFAFDWAPLYFASCAGQILSISQNSALYSLLDTRFGGDGRVSFGLPDLRGRVPVGCGQGPGLSDRIVGQPYGQDSVTLIQSQMPSHTHTISEQTANNTASLNAKGGVANQQGPANHYLAVGVEGTTTVKMYSDAAPDHTLASDAVTINTGNLVNSTAGGMQPLVIDQPSLVIGYVICTNGVYPSRQ